MDEQATRARNELLERVPSAPYPGLRPFLDFEAMLMYGRRSQAGEVVERLGSSGFVAVIGGSGSGKSSLIRAGVVPHLRQYGIPHVGDLWAPIVFTPGTNFASTAGQSPQTPITRLAWKFELALRGERSDARRDDIAELLRRPGGLQQMLEAYGDDLETEGGSPASACFLFVVDQFEELFDKSNASVDDARQLIERVIDHFHQSKLGNGPGRCFLALTMRSEHLNDCAGYLGLPEAINAGSYLVSRLDERQLREAIEKPANRFLRLRHRQGGSGLPDAVAFEPAVVDRLVADAGHIAHDPDHLPLLQHALARVWDEACLRENVGALGVPAAVTMDDLQRAATAGRSAGLTDTDNVLRCSLNNWAEQIFSRKPGTQKQVEALLRRLGYKDATAGTYNQQRIQVTEYEGGKEQLWALVKDDFVGHVNYLFWDDENPQRVTLKVSHESFIRGWTRFRRLVDEEAVRLEQFAMMLRACRDWVADNENDTALMEPRQLRRLRDAGIEGILHAAAASNGFDAGEWKTLRKGLRHVASGEGLDALPPDKIQTFYERSARAQQIAVRRERRRLAYAGAVVGLVLPTAFMVTIVQLPALDRAMAFLDASGQANRARLQDSIDSVGGGAEELQRLIDSAQTFRRGLDGEGIRWASWSNALLHHWLSPLSWFDLKLASIPFKASSTVEPMINAKLRQALVKSVWQVAPRLPADDSQVVDRSSNPPIAITCMGLRGNLSAAEGSREGDRVRRGIFVTDEVQGSAKAGRRSENRLVFSATLTEGKDCTLGEQVFALPADRDPALLFDAGLSYVMLSLTGNPGQTSTVSVHRVDWQNPDTGERAAILPPLTTVVDEQSATLVREQAASSMVAPATWRVAGGRAVRIGGQGWRTVSDRTTRLVPQPDDGELVPLGPPGADDKCKAVASFVDAGDKASNSDGFTTVGYQARSYCIVVSRGVAPTDGGKRDEVIKLRSIGAGGEGSLDGDRVRETVIVRTYARPRSLEGTPPQVSSATTIATIELGSYRPSENGWLVGKPCTRYEGWVILRREANDRNPVRYVGAPWATDALARLGKEVLADQAQVAGPAVAPDPAYVSKRCKAEED